MNKNIVTGILLSLISSVLFGFIDSLFFLIGESSLQSVFNNISFFDENMSELTTGGISAAVSLFVATGLVKLIKHKAEIIESPFVDAIGIIIGMLIVLLGYYIYKEISKINNNNNNNRVSNDNNNNNNNNSVSSNRANNDKNSRKNNCRT
jgi:xanthosine utilization system XapX-like protein